jgi:GNAT superfamily N-acetyltransferase
MIMEITGIGKENIEYFEPYLLGPLAPEQSALGLIGEGAAIGAVAVSEHEGVCTIESLFVDPEHQRKGGGTLLMNALKECGEDVGLKDYLIFYGEDEILTAFLRKTGFTCMPKGEVMEIPVNRILSTETFQKLRGKEPDEGIRLVKDLSKQEKNDIQKMITEAGFQRDLLTYPDLVPELSYAAFDGEKPEGVLIANRDDEDFFVSLLLVDEDSQRIFRKLLSAFANSLNHQAKRGSILKFVNRNEKLRETMEMMIGEKFTASGHTWMGVLSL